MRPALRPRTLALGLALLPSMAAAQDFDRVVPKLPPAQEPPKLDVPAEPAATPSDGSVLVPELRGIVFVSGLDRLAKDGISAESLPGGIAAQNLPVLSTPDFSTKVQPFLGRPLTQADLDAIGRLVRQTYLASQRPFVDVAVPPQNVQSGVIQVVITEYRIGEVRVVGNRHFSTELIRFWGGLDTGDTLTLPRMNKALDRYNRNPFLNVSAVVKPGSETGLSDIELQAEDRLPVRVYGGYDNQGSPTLDRDEWYAGFNWGNVFGTGGILSYQYTRAFNGRYDSHSGSFVLPTGVDDRLLLFGAYATQKPFLAELFDSEGHSGQVSVRWSHDLPQTGTMKQSFQIGADVKRTDNNLEFAGFRVLDTAVEIFQIPVVYSASSTDPFGETTIENLLVFSPGDVTDQNTDEAFRQLVPGSDSTYAYNRFSVTRTTLLPKGLSWIARGMLQIASDNLPYSEQVGGGGIGSVRGYDTNTALGSNGVLVSQELRSPAFSLFQSGASRDQLQFGVFVDYAYLWNRDRFPDFRNNSRLASVGVNLHYSFDRYVDLQVEVGQQLTRPPLQRDRDIQAAIIATVSF